MNEKRTIYSNVTTKNLMFAYMGKFSGPTQEVVNCPLLFLVQAAAQAEQAAFVVGIAESRSRENTRIRAWRKRETVKKYWDRHAADAELYGQLHAKGSA